MTDNFCKDCEFCLNNGSELKFAKCLQCPKENLERLVTGCGVPEYLMCSTARDDNSGLCGTDGQLFTPRKIVL